MVSPCSAQCSVAASLELALHSHHVLQGHSGASSSARHPWTVDYRFYVSPRYATGAYILLDTLGECCYILQMPEEYTGPYPWQRILDRNSGALHVYQECCSRNPFHYEPIVELPQVQDLQQCARYITTTSSQLKKPVVTTRDTLQHDLPRFTFNIVKANTFEHYFRGHCYLMLDTAGCCWMLLDMMAW